MKARALYSKIAPTLIPILLTLASGTIILLLAGANPLEAYGNIITGALGNPRKVADVAVAVAPLLPCPAGTPITFAAGLWYIGVGGQMLARALSTSWL